MDLIPSPHPTPSKALQLQPAYQANEADPKHMAEACFPGRRLKNVRLRDTRQTPGSGLKPGQKRVSKAVSKSASQKFASADEF